MLCRCNENTSYTCTHTNGLETKLIPAVCRHVDQFARRSVVAPTRIAPTLPPYYTHIVPILYTYCSDI